MKNFPLTNLASILFILALFLVLYYLPALPR